jgi:hypothetical protein
MSFSAKSSFVSRKSEASGDASILFSSAIQGFFAAAAVFVRVGNIERQHVDFQIVDLKI